MEKSISKEGFTLLELMVCCAVTIIALTGLLSAYVACYELNETMRNSNLAISAAQKVLEEIRSTPFLSVYANYNGYQFQVSGMPVNKNLGRVVVDNTNPNLLQVDVGVCWSQKGSRILGECSTGVGGTLVFNDANVNGKLDSPVQFTTLMSQR
jgi:Tfp pilus assembly protein PilV